MRKKVVPCENRNSPLSRSTGRGQVWAAAPNPAQSRTQNVPSGRFSAQGTGGRAEASVIRGGILTACQPACFVLRVSSLFLFDLTVWPRRQDREHPYVPASARRRFPPCRGLRRRTASCATGTTGDSAQPSFPPSTEPCLTQEWH